MPVLIVALGMTLVILTGRDRHLGRLAVRHLQRRRRRLRASRVADRRSPALAAAVVGALLGAINGALVAYVRIPSIVVTLATMVALRDGLRWITQGAWVQDLPPGFQWFGFPRPPVTVILMRGRGDHRHRPGAWALRNLAAGRAVYATGSDAEAARLAGIDPARVMFCVFVVTGALTGLAALLNAVRFNQIPSNAGLGLELKVIAAVVVGGTAITGGRGSRPGHPPRRRPARHRSARR